MGSKRIINVQDIKYLTPSMNISVGTEAEFVGVRQGVAFGLRLLEICGYLEIEPAAKVELKERLDAAMDRGEGPRRKPKATVGWFTGLYNVLRLLSKTEREKLKRLFPLDSLKHL